MGGNEAQASSSVQTSAYLGNCVTMNAGDAIGGLADGGTYYVIVDRCRPFYPATDIASDMIDLGADHALTTGDRVTYLGTEGDDPVGGLTYGATYRVEVDADDPYKIRLRDSADQLVHLDGSVATGSGHRFDIRNPTRVKLATTYENAVGASPVAINLSDPATYGADHSLQPVTTGDAGAQFNPLFALDAAGNAIDLGADQELYTGHAMVYRKGAGPSLTIEALGDDWNKAGAEAGSGGLFAGSAAHAQVTATSSTRAYLADDDDLGDSSQTTLELSRLHLNAHHTARFDSQTSTLQAAVVGMSGSFATNTVNSTVEAVIGDNARITAHDLVVESTNTSRKDLVTGYNVEAGSGGVFEGNAARSETDIANITHASVGPRAQIEIVGDPSLPGEFRMTAYNDVEGADDVRLDSGGLIVGSGVTCAIRADTNDAIVEIGHDARITTVGDVDLETRARGVLTVEPTVHTYGLASVAKVDALARIHNNNQVNIDHNAFIEARGELNFLAGSLRNGTTNYFNVTSHGDELNAAVIPISDLKSHGEIVQSHSVNIASGAQVRTARDANLDANRYGNVHLTAYGTGLNWMSGAAEAIDSWFGSDGVADELKGGTGTNQLNATVTVNGTLEVGILKDQALSLPIDYLATRAVDEQTEGVSFSCVDQSMAASLMRELEHWSDLRVEYAGDPIAEAAYQNEIDRVEQQMRAMGLYDEGDPADPDDDAYITRYIVPFIVVNDIWAQSGTIHVTALDLLGTGRLLAPGNVTVSIDNYSPAFLQINDITIPDSLGGRLRFNGQDVTTAAQIAGINLSGAAPSFAELLLLGDSSSPSIEIHSYFSADDAPPGYEAFMTPDIDLVGDITNILGSVTITGRGSIYESGNIDAGTVTITSDGDFVQTYSDVLRHEGGDPSAIWTGVTGQTEELGRGSAADTLSYQSNGAGTEDDQAIEDAVTAALGSPSTSNIIQGGNVYLSGRYLNINGTIQSGKPQQAVTIDAGDEPYMTAARTAYQQHRDGDDAAARDTVAANELVLADDTYRLYWLAQDALTDIHVRYDAELDRLDVRPARVEGGYMQLFGNIVSTGGGRLNVLDGYGRISVNNETAHDLVLDELDAGRGVSGMLRITDVSEGSATPTVHEFYRQDGVMWRKIYRLPGPGEEDPTIIQMGPDSGGGVRTATYTPEAGTRFFWMTGEAYTTATTTTWGQSEWLGIDSFARDPSTVVSQTGPEYLDGKSLMQGAYFASSGLSSDYAYDFLRLTNGEPITIPHDPTPETESTWYGTKTYYVTETLIEGWRNIHTHSIRADRTINIEFTGFDLGNSNAGVFVDSPHGNILINDSIQNSGGRTELATMEQIRLINRDATVGGREIELAAGHGIGADLAIRINLADDASGGLEAGTVDGAIRVEEISGDMIVVQAGSIMGGDIELTTHGSILPASEATRISGGAITLMAEYGEIGSLGTGGTANAPTADARALVLNTGTRAENVLSATAAGNVFIVEASGDLRLASVQAGGDVRIEVNTGNLVDANTNEKRDPRTEEQLEALWDRMWASETTAQHSIDATMSAYQGLKTREYHGYWQYRNQQTDDRVQGLTHGMAYYAVVHADGSVSLADSLAHATSPFPVVLDIAPSTATGATHWLYRIGLGAPLSFDSIADVDDATNSICLTIGHGLSTGDQVVYCRAVAYDPEFHVMLSPAENAFYTGYYTTEGTTQGLSGDELTAYVQNAITTLENQRTTEYHTLQKTYGEIGNLGAVHHDPAIYNPNWAYVVTDVRLHRKFGAADVDAQNSIELSTHVFTTGQAVVYHGGGGSIPGLVDGETYYVVQDGADFSRVQLAATRDDALAVPPVVIALNPATITGTGHWLSDGDVITQRAAWSESQLKNTVSASILRPKSVPGTTLTVEAPNIVGRSIALVVSGDVGVIGATVAIEIWRREALTEEQKLCLAAAEQGDVTFYMDVAGRFPIEPDDLTYTPALARVEVREDVDVQASGVVNVIESANANLGSEQSIRVDRVNADGEVRIKVQEGIVDGRSDVVDPVNIRGGDIILEAETQGIGSATDPILIDLTPGRALAAARASGDIYIVETSGDMIVGEVFSATGVVNLRADGAILDRDEDDSTTAYWNIGAAAARLEAGTGAAMTGSIGAIANLLEIDLQPGGVLWAQADRDIGLSEVAGDMLVDSVASALGDVRLKAAGSILDADEGEGIPSNPRVDVIGNNITLEAGEFGAVGVVGDDLDIDTSHSAAGTLTSSSGLNAYLIEVSGALRLYTVQTDAGTAFIAAPVGSILNGNPAGSNVTGGKTYLFAANDIGQATRPITSRVGNVEGQSTAGSTWLTNTGDLIVGGVADSGDAGVESGGSTQITATSPITVIEDILAEGDITLTATDSAEAGDDLTVLAGIAIQSAAGAITLRAGDNVSIELGASVAAAGALTIEADYGRPRRGRRHEQSHPRELERRRDRDPRRGRCGHDHARCQCPCRQHYRPCAGLRGRGRGCHHREPPQ